MWDLWVVIPIHCKKIGKLTYWSTCCTVRELVKPLLAGQYGFVLNELKLTFEKEFTKRFTITLPTVVLLSLSYCYSKFVIPVFHRIYLKFLSRKCINHQN